MFKLCESIKSRFFKCSSIKECVSTFTENFFGKINEIRHKFKDLFRKIFRRIRSAH